MTEVPTKERPILFSGAMVRAILDGTKTQTRRVISNVSPNTARSWIDTSPYGVPGCRLWVRETWQAVRCWDDGHVEWPQRIPKERGRWHAVYAADNHPEHAEDRGWPWRPSIYMPRWVSRIDLQVTGVRVEQVQDISDGDAYAEGIPPHCRFPLDDFRLLWDSINANRGYGWGVNPWVWVVEFRRIRP